MYSSSDTVNELLDGLANTKHDQSIQALTEETAKVLPTFAKVLDISTSRSKFLPTRNWYTEDTCIYSSGQTFFLMVGNILVHH